MAGKIKITTGSMKKSISLLLLASFLCAQKTQAFDDWKPSEITIAALLGASVITNVFCLYHIHHQQQIIYTKQSETSDSVSQLSQSMSTHFSALNKTLREIDDKTEARIKNTSHSHDVMMKKLDQVHERRDAVYELCRQYTHKLWERSIREMVESSISDATYHLMDQQSVRNAELFLTVLQGAAASDNRARDNIRERLEKFAAERRKKKIYFSR
jgi:hypothetical protein